MIFNLNRPRSLDAAAASLAVFIAGAEPIVTAPPAEAQGAYLGDRGTEAERQFEELAGAVDRMQRDLAPGGSLDRRLNDSSLDRAGMEGVFEAIGQVNMRLYTLLNVSRDAKKRSELAAALPKSLRDVVDTMWNAPGPMVLPLNRTDGARSKCNAFAAMSGPDPVIVTDDHCVEKTVEAKEFVAGNRHEPGGADIAFHRMSENERRKFADSTGRFLMDVPSGTIVMIDGHNLSEDRREVYPGVLVRVTASMARVMNLPPANIGRYAMLIPPWAAFGTNFGNWTSGMSGSAIRVVEDQTNPHTPPVLGPLDSAAFPEMGDVQNGTMPKYVLAISVSPDELKGFVNKFNDSRRK